MEISERHALKFLLPKTQTVSVLSLSQIQQLNELENDIKRTSLEIQRYAKALAKIRQ